VTPPLLQLDSVSRQFDIGNGRRLDVLRDINLAMAQGESLAIVGPSGCGKSTLLNIIGTLDRPSSGSVRILGRDVSGLDGKALARARNEQIGFVFQLHHLLPQCSVLENVLVPAVVAGGGDAVVERARGLLDKVGLSDRLDHRPAELSGGECQRVAVVRALINAPCLLLADEPTGSLDRRGSDQLAELLSLLNRDEGVTLVMVTHAPSVAERMARVLELRDGVLECCES